MIFEIIIFIVITEIIYWKVFPWFFDFGIDYPDDISLLVLKKITACLIGFVTTLIILGLILQFNNIMVFLVEHAMGVLYLIGALLGISTFIGINVYFMYKKNKVKK